MSVEATVTVKGLKESLSILRDISPQAKAEAMKKIKAAGGELVQEARKPYATSAPLSGWSPKGRLGYSPGAVSRGVQIQVGGRTPRGANAFPMVTLVQKNAGGALFDLAGLRGGSVPGRNGPHPSFLEGLDSKYGKAQRGMWRSVRLLNDTTYKALHAAIEEVADSANRKLVR